MVTKNVTVINDQGIHMRPAGLLVAEAKKFKGTEITLETAEKKAKGSSVMQIMAAGIKKGTEVTITCSGPDEAAALGAFVNLFETGFGE